LFNVSAASKIKVLSKKSAALIAQVAVIFYAVSLSNCFADRRQVRPPKA
jgi:hypothetical protein